MREQTVYFLNRNTCITVKFFRINACNLCRNFFYLRCKIRNSAYRNRNNVSKIMKEFLKKFISTILSYKKPHPNIKPQNSSCLFYKWENIYLIEAVSFPLSADTVLVSDFKKSLENQSGNN